MTDFYRRRIRNGKAIGESLIREKQEKEQDKELLKHLKRVLGDPENRSSGDDRADSHHSSSRRDSHHSRSRRDSHHHHSHAFKEEPIDMTMMVPDPPAAEPKQKN